MAAHEILGSQASSCRGKSLKVNDSKHFDQKVKKNHHNNNNNVNPAFNISTFEPPAVTTNGMKNIEQFIEKTFVEGKQWYQCKWQNCSYSTLRSDSIVRHMRKHTGERPYKCWYCSYATIQSSALKIHMRRHTGERPYICKYDNCGKKFAVLNTLVVHERTHTGYKPFMCPQTSCNYTSSDRCKLVGHMRKSHQMELPSNKAQLAHHVTAPLMNNTAFPIDPSLHNKSNPFAFVNGPMSSAQLFSPLMANYSPFAIPNSQLHIAQNEHNREKQPEMPSTSLHLPLNFLSVSLSNNNLQNTLSTTVNLSKSKSSNQNRHLQSHTGERLYVCPHEGCHYATIQRSTLNKHLSRHVNSTF